MTAPWDESTVTWNSINTALSGSAAYNLEQVDDEDVASVTAVGNWPTSNVGTPNGSSGWRESLLPKMYPPPKSHTTTGSFREGFLMAFPGT